VEKKREGATSAPMEEKMKGSWPPHRCRRRKGAKK
jgi:hypothetical protein